MRLLINFFTITWGLAKFLFEHREKFRFARSFPVKYGEQSSKALFVIQMKRYKT
jgi:hypothetical protein